MIIEETQGRFSGIPVLGQVPWGTHFCQFYQTKQHLMEVLVPYFKAGLEQDELCVLVTSETLSSNEAREALRAVIPDLAAREAKGQLEIFPYQEWYTAGGFDMNRVLEGWQRKYCHAMEKGFAGLRVSGDTAWLEGKDWDSFSHYEQSIDGAIEGSNILVLCTYNLDRCGPYELLDVVRNHQFALVLGHRGWERIEHAEVRRLREMHQASETRYSQLFNAMSEGFALHEIICDGCGEPIDYRFLAVNQAFEKLTGLKRQKVIGSTVMQLMPDIEPSWIDRYGKVALTGEPAHFRAYSKSLDRWFEVFAYSTQHGQFAAMFLDVTEAQSYQEQLRQKAQELARSNRDLEQFAYVASHDLQEPLRMISGFLELLSSKYRQHLDSKAEQYIGYAVDGAKRMQSMIRDLLEYSRVGNNGMKSGVVDFSDVMNDVMANLESAIKETGAIINASALPTLNADGAQMRQLLQNLVGNSLKFRVDGRRPEVHVSATLEAEKWVFHVKDNGIGINPEYADRIFQIFQRLHSREKYSGCGIGLALCKKIVERHGGRIWVESQEGQGSVFHFTLANPV